MISPKKIHEWLLKALEEPFFRAEMHKVEILLQNNPEKKTQQRKECEEESKTEQKESKAGPSQKNSRFTTLSGKIFSR